MNIHSSFANKRVLTAGAMLLAALATAPAASAQDGAPRQEQRATPEERLDRRVAMLTERLALTAEQATRIRAILQEQTAEMQRLRQARQGEERERGEGMAEARASQQRYEARIDAVLTASQRAAYRELRESQRRERGGRGGRRGAPQQS
ncbi:MAG TPA: hypothetical protein VF625_14210 [Longimicrobium sp.]